MGISMFEHSAVNGVDRRSKHAETITDSAIVLECNAAPDSAPLLTVIVPTRNEQGNIALLLERLGRTLPDQPPPKIGPARGPV